MSELSFLLDLLLNEKLSKPVKEKITLRVAEVEKTFYQYPKSVQTGAPLAVTPSGGFLPANLPPHIAGQSPSTIAKFLEHQALGLPPVTAIGEVAPGAVPTAPAVVAATPQAIAAVAKRDQAIATALSGKPEPGRTSPRKF